MQKLFVWGVRRYAGGSSRSWLWTSAALLGVRVLRSATGRREVIDVSKVKPGHRIVIEHRTISHRKQMKEFKAEERAAKREAKAQRRVARAAGAPRFRRRSEPLAGKLEA